MKIASNKKARHDYEILKKYEAGIALNGNEIKSIRDNRVNLKDSFIKVNSKNEIFLYNAHISAYKQAHKVSENDAIRPRKLLLHKKEIISLKESSRETGYAIICLTMYFKKNYVKVEIALAKGKKLHDKRQSIKEKDLKREMQRTLKYR
ncbi:MAG: SsrA-binding protein SmpB [Mycoplasmatales bacterium]